MSILGDVLGDVIHWVGQIPENFGKFGQGIGERVEDFGEWGEGFGENISDSVSSLGKKPKKPKRPGLQEEDTSMLRMLAKDAARRRRGLAGRSLLRTSLRPGSSLGTTTAGSTTKLGK